jgi:hypothetical protein
MTSSKATPRLAAVCRLLARLAPGGGLASGRSAASGLSLLRGAAAAVPEKELQAGPGKELLV